MPLEHLHCTSYISIFVACAELQLEGYLEMACMEECEGAIGILENEKILPWKIK